MIRFLKDRLNSENQRKLIEALAVLNVILLIAGGIFAIKLADVTSTNHKLAVQGKEAHDAVCTLKRNLSQRVTYGRNLLQAHPKAKEIDADKGPGVFMISRELLQSSVSRDADSLEGLKSLSCSH